MTVTPHRQVVDSSLLEAATIVVIDDVEPNVALLDRVLTSAGARNVCGFTDPVQALDACRHSRPDLVLVDLHMPTMDATEVIHALNAELPHGVFVPVVVLTADITIEARRRVLAAGAKDFITKPFDITEVLLRVGNLLETGALYRRLEEHNTELRTQLEEQAAKERRSHAELQQRHQRIDSILNHKLLTMVFQPIVAIDDGTVVGAEALARFTIEPPRPPNDWFAEAAAVGRSEDLELLAISEAVARIDELPPALFLSVNASPGTVCTPALIDTLKAASPERVAIEITEHQRVDDYEPLIDALTTLRSLGAKVAVDDTGAGYASLTHILRLGADILKLDIGLTRGLDSDPVRRSLAAALVTFSRETGSQIIAEGVETAEELRALQDLGVHWAQGYHLARPMDLPLPDRCRPS